MVAFSFPVDVNHRFFFFPSPLNEKKREGKKRALKRREKKNCFFFLVSLFTFFFLFPDVESVFKYHMKSLISFCFLFFRLDFFPITYYLRVVLFFTSFFFSFLSSFW